MKKIYYLEVNSKAISPSFDWYDEALAYGYEIKTKVKGRLKLVSTDGYKHTVEKMWEEMD